MPTRARDGEGQRGWGLGFTMPVGWISAGRRYMSTDPVRPGLVAPEAEDALPDAAAPTRLTKKGALPLVSEAGWARSAPVRSQNRETAGMGSRN